MSYSDTIMRFEEIVSAIEPLYRKVLELTSPEEKLELLDNLHEVKEFLLQSIPLTFFLSQTSLIGQIVVKSLIAVGQGGVIFQGIENGKERFNSLSLMVDQLIAVEKFYRAGLIGYYYQFIMLASPSRSKGASSLGKTSLLYPQGVDITGRNPKQLKSAIKSGIDRIPDFAEIYVVGGAGDRLNWVDKKSKKPLSAATLPFEGSSLLEGLFRDLAAKEFLHWKLYDVQQTTPVAMMTSLEKDNHFDIVHICQKRNWFGRPLDSIRLFTQPLVPVITAEGNFSLSAPLTLTLKPGGHGVIWKLANDEGVFEWLTAHNVKKLLLRQINNPIAGTDSTLLAFMGIGSSKNKAFGFACCPRRSSAAEGMVGLKEVREERKYRYTTTNIEYTQFSKNNLKDEKITLKGDISTFPANSNILFADIDAVRQVIAKKPIPGVIINMKGKAPFIDSQNRVHECLAGRLEALMQSISDEIIDEQSSPIDVLGQHHLRTFVTHSERQKTLSVTKQEFQPNVNTLDTPESCFYDILANNVELLSDHCGMTLPALISFDEYLIDGPPFIIRYHPALGPLYNIIGQKICKGVLSKGCELLLEIAELAIENLYLDGSLQIFAQGVMGEQNHNGIIRYSNNNGKCELKNVRVVNRGVNWLQSDNCYWKNEIERTESLHIILHGNGEFFAEDVTFEGGMRIEVQSGHRMTVTMVDGVAVYNLVKIQSPTWYWDYHYLSDNSIAITKIESGDENSRKTL